MGKVNTFQAHKVHKNIILFTHNGKYACQVTVARGINIMFSVMYEFDC